MKVKEGQAVWVADPAIAGTDLFSQGHVISVADNGKATVETRPHHGGKSHEIIVPEAECYHTNVGAHVPDHCQLVYLSQPTLLDNTRRRFSEDKIYTYVGEILVAVNPFKWIEGMYGAPLRRRHHTLQRDAGRGPAERRQRRVASGRDARQLEGAAMRRLDANNKGEGQRSGVEGGDAEGRPRNLGGARGEVDEGVLPGGREGGQAERRARKPAGLVAEEGARDGMELGPLAACARAGQTMGFLGPAHP